MLTWQDFYKETGLDLGVKCAKSYNGDSIYIFPVNINLIANFFTSRGFEFSSLFNLDALTDSIRPEKSSALYKISNTKSNTSKECTLFEILIYLASRVFFNDIDIFSKDFRVTTSDGYDISLVIYEDEEGVSMKRIVIGSKNEFVEDRFYSECRFSPLTTT